MPLADTLKRRLEHDIKDENCVFDGDRLRVKISGDGTRLGKRCHVLTFGYSVVSKTMRQSPVQLLAIVKGPESYNTWAESLKDIISGLHGVDFSRG